MAQVIVRGTASELKFAVQADKENPSILITTVSIRTQSLTSDQLAVLGKLEQVGASFTLEQLQATMGD